MMKPKTVKINILYCIAIEEDVEGGMPSKFKRKPPSMDSLMNNVKSITKKIEHIKGFKFEIAPALSNNFHLSSSWVIPP